MRNRKFPKSVKVVNCVTEWFSTFVQFANFIVTHRTCLKMWSKVSKGRNDEFEKIYFVKLPEEYLASQNGKSS